MAYQIESVALTPVANGPLLTCWIGLHSYEN